MLWHGLPTMTLARAKVSNSDGDLRSHGWHGQETVPQPTMRYNGVMTLPGRVHNGVIVLEGGSALPEGAAVSVSYSAPNGAPRVSVKTRIAVPLVRTGRPGSVALTGPQIAEILNTDDVSPRH